MKRSPRSLLDFTEVRFRTLDLAALLFALAVTGAFGWNMFRSDAAGGPPMLVMRTPAGEWVYPLSENREFAAYEGEGVCRIAVQDGSARVVSSDCPNRICIGMGSIDQSGQWIACVPHQVFLRVEGSDPEAPDAVSL